MPRAKLSDVSLGQLLAEVNRRKSKLADLIVHRAALDAEIASLQALVGAPAKATRKPGPKPGKKPGRKPGRKAEAKAGGKPLREGSLKALLVAALAGKKGLSVGDAMEAVQAAGYKSQSKNFRLLVNQTLLNEPEFKKVRRGIFTVKGQPAVESTPKKAAGRTRRLKATGKPGPKPKASRGRRGKPLAAFVQEALAAAPKGLAVRDIEKAVLAAGYVTKGKDLYNPIGAVLGKIGAKKVARGVYALKPAGKKPGAKPRAEAPAEEKRD